MENNGEFEVNVDSAVDNIVEKVSDVGNFAAVDSIQTAVRERLDVLTGTAKLDQIKTYLESCAEIESKYGKEYAEKYKSMVAGSLGLVPVVPDYDDFYSDEAVTGWVRFPVVAATALSNAERSPFQIDVLEDRSMNRDPEYSQIFEKDDYITLGDWAKWLSKIQAIHMDLGLLQNADMNLRKFAEKMQITNRSALTYLVTALFPGFDSRAVLRYCYDNTKKLYGHVVCAAFTKHLRIRPHGASVVFSKNSVFLHPGVFEHYALHMYSRVKGSKLPAGSIRDHEVDAAASWREYYSVYHVACDGLQGYSDEVLADSKKLSKLYTADLKALEKECLEKRAASETDPELETSSESTTASSEETTASETAKHRKVAKHYPTMDQISRAPGGKVFGKGKKGTTLKSAL